MTKIRKHKRKKKKSDIRLILVLSSISLLFKAVLFFSVIILPIALHTSSQLPDYYSLKNYFPPTITRVYTANGNLAAEYAAERRIYTEYKDIPEYLIAAFVAAEDKNFFEHKGIDTLGMMRSAFQTGLNLIAGNQQLVGGSTITQQVVKNFLLTNEKTLKRKIKEAILAYRINKIYSKEKILELYINQIFLGNNSYGIAAAAQNYFNKKLIDLSIEEAALLAALPKSPSRLNPYVNYERALARRNWVIERMVKEKFISKSEGADAILTKINLDKKHKKSILPENHYSKTVKRQLIKVFGFEKIHRKGYVVFSNMDEDIQKAANEAFQDGIISYDKRHGWRGSIANIKGTENIDISMELAKYTKNLIINHWKPALVKDVQDDHASIALNNHELGTVHLKDMKWARKCMPNQTLGSHVRSAHQVLYKGDIILVSQYMTPEGNFAYKLEQIPDVNGAMVVIEPTTGKVFAIVGGHSFNNDNFNRATQAKRQPGSVFKPFVYLAALENGWQLNDIVTDEPIKIEQEGEAPAWEPKNYERNHLGDITIRKAFEKSRNIPTVKLLLSLGVNKVLDVSKRLGMYKGVRKATYSLALGAFETTLLQITSIYNAVANNGIYLQPKFIDSVYNNGRLLYGDNEVYCEGCYSDGVRIPEISYIGKRIIDVDTNYQFLTLFKGVMERGTGRKAYKAIGKIMGGKTGTTNNSVDAWFIGFTPAVTVGIYVGFDKPKTLGKESGATVAMPIFTNFMKKIKHMLVDTDFRKPPGIVLKPVNQISGEILNSSDIDSNTIYEAFKKAKHFDPNIPDTEVSKQSNNLILDLFSVFNE